MPRQRLRNICCLIAAWDTNPTLRLRGTRYAQGRVNLACIVFRKNRSQDAGATEASALEDGAPVGTQDLDLKDPGSKASCLPSWGCQGECLWELCLAGDPRVIRCTEGTEVVKDAAGGEMMNSPSSLGVEGGSTSMFSECSVLFRSAGQSSDHCLLQHPLGSLCKTFHPKKETLLTSLHPWIPSVYLVTIFLTLSMFSSSV